MLATLEPTNFTEVEVAPEASTSFTENKLPPETLTAAPLANTRNVERSTLTATDFGSPVKSKVCTLATLSIAANDASCKVRLRLALVLVAVADAELSWTVYKITRDSPVVMVSVVLNDTPANTDVTSSCESTLPLVAVEMVSKPVAAL